VNLPAAALPPGAIDERVRLALFGQLFAATPQAVAGGILFAGVVALVVGGYAPPAWAWGWFLVKAGIGIVRIAHVRRFLNASVEASSVGPWVRTYMFWIGLDVLTWAAMLPLFGSGADAPSAMLLVCGLLGVASLGVFTTVPHWPLCVLYSTVCMGTTATWFALRGQPDDWAIATASLIYLALLIMESRRGNAHLVEMIRLRYQNAALAEERAAALAAAQSSDTAKSRFLAMVSHEMRTPLNGIMGMAQVLRAEIVEPARARSLELLENSARLLARIIGDLLDLARMEAGDLAVRSEKTDLRRQIDEVVALLGPLAEARGLSLTSHWPDDAPSVVLSDGTRIGQVLHNLVGNALKFTHQGSVRLQVRYSEPSSWCIDVVDTGPGIAAEDRERIFEAFERVGDVGLVPGTGLGLTISRRLARALGGEVSCTSEPGHGSTFSFTFAADAVHNPEIDAATAQMTTPLVPQPPRPHDAVVPAAGRAGVVLVVDDNEVNALVAGALLEQLGWAHRAVGDGAQALEVMARGGLSAVLMDCHMPVLDGWEATRRWRGAETGRRLPIIGITANATDADRQSCLDAGMDDHLPKPFEKEALGQALVRLALAPPP